MAAFCKRRTCVSEKLGELPKTTQLLPERYCSRETGHCLEEILSTSGAFSLYYNPKWRRD
jgi:hypothetical protein